MADSKNDMTKYLRQYQDELQTQLKKMTEDPKAMDKMFSFFENFQKNFGFDDNNADNAESSSDPLSELPKYPTMGDIERLNGKIERLEKKLFAIEKKLGLRKSISKPNPENNKEDKEDKEDSK